jgi:S-adenosylmethionine/arginine decarboxylase-like enzyme
MNYWGKHLLIDCYDCDKSKISSRDVIDAFIKDLVIKIDMKAYGEPIIEHFATHDPSKGGYTACQMIETSLIDGHFVDETGAAYISVHSCKDFDNETVLAVIKDHFNPGEMVSNTVLRK